MKNESTFRASGTVKWFEKSKGFGFIVCAETGEDMLIHANVLRDFGQKSLASGSVVEVIATRSGQGLQVVELLSLTVPGLDQIEDDEDETHPAQATAARVKWFDQARGFGFVEAYLTGKEAFLHADTLARAGLTEVDEGEALNVDIADGSRGPVVRAIRKWIEHQQNADAA